MSIPPSPLVELRIVNLMSNCVIYTQNEMKNVHSRSFTVATKRFQFSDLPSGSVTSELNKYSVRNSYLIRGTKPSSRKILLISYSKFFSFSTELAILEREVR